MGAVVSQIMDDMISQSKQAKKEQHPQPQQHPKPSAEDSVQKPPVADRCDPGSGGMGFHVSNLVLYSSDMPSRNGGANVMNAVFRPSDLVYHQNDSGKLRSAGTCGESSQVSGQSSGPKVQNAVYRIR